MFIRRLQPCCSAQESSKESLVKDTSREPARATLSESGFTVPSLVRTLGRIRGNVPMRIDSIGSIDGRKRGEVQFRIDEYQSTSIGRVLL